VSPRVAEVASRGAAGCLAPAPAHHPLSAESALCGLGSQRLTPCPHILHAHGAFKRVCVTLHGRLSPRRSPALSSTASHSIAPDPAARPACCAPLLISSLVVLPGTAGNWGAQRPAALAWPALPLASPSAPAHWQVFERRDHPDRISSDAEDRAFVVGLNVRGRAAMDQVRAAGHAGASLGYSSEKCFHSTCLSIQPPTCCSCRIHVNAVCECSCTFQPALPNRRPVTSHPPAILPPSLPHCVAVLPLPLQAGFDLEDFERPNSGACSLLAGLHAAGRKYTQKGRLGHPPQPSAPATAPKPNPTPPQS